MTRLRPTLRIPALTLAALAAASGWARGDFLVVPTPTAAYQATTSKVPIIGAQGTVDNAISDGTLTITLSAPTTVATVGPGVFGWGNPPTVEATAPAVLFSQFQLSRTLTFNQALSTFGVEMQSNNGTSFLNPNFTLTATFFDGGTLVGTISQRLVAPGGARLFAASTTTDPFTSVTLTSSSGSGGFNFGQVRYTVATVPEPSSLTLAILGICGHGLAWCLRRAKRGVAMET
jgi:hypothetical protein